MALVASIFLAAVIAMFVAVEALGRPAVVA
jgi:hypothetical protein